jgi:DnaJ-class molecular chaperone
MDKCKECGGSRQTIVEDFEFGNHPVTCTHCQGTGIEPEVIPIDVPDGFNYVYKDDVRAVFRHIDFHTIETYKLSYTIGQTYDEVCEVCGGRGWQKSNFIPFNTLGMRKDCPSCKGKPTQYKIKDIQVKDNNFIIYKGALTNKRDLRTGWKYK